MFFSLKDLDACLACGEKTHVVDVHGMRWCEEHEYRAKMAQWAAEHGYPHMNCEPYVSLAFGPEELSWRMNLAMGSDEQLYIVDELIHQIDEHGGEISPFDSDALTALITGRPKAQATATPNIETREERGA